MQKAEEFKVSLRIQAYLGWLIHLMQPIDRKHRKLAFEDWLNDFGLGEKGEKEPEDVESLKEKSLEIAQKIIEIDKKNRS